MHFYFYFDASPLHKTLPKPKTFRILEKDQHGTRAMTAMRHRVLHVRMVYHIQIISFRSGCTICGPVAIPPPTTTTLCDMVLPSGQRQGCPGHMGQSSQAWQHTIPLGIAQEVALATSIFLRLPGHRV